MTQRNLVNAVDTTLSSSIDDVVTTMTVTDASKFPVVPFYCVVEPFGDALREYMECTAVNGNDLTVVRNLAGSASGTAHPHVNDVTIRIAIMAQHLEDVWDRVTTVVFNVMDYGAVGDGVTDDSTAIQAAIDAAKVAGGEVFLPIGRYKIDTALDLSNINAPNSDYVTPIIVKMRGAGSNLTFLIGGDTPYGLIEMVGSNKLAVEGMTLLTDGTLQYGIMLGRMSGDGSSGQHLFSDLIIRGSFTLAAIFAMSAEICSYKEITVSLQAGMGIVLAREKGSYSPSTRYTALSTTPDITGGNGQISMENIEVLSSSSTVTDYLIVLEYVQTFTATNVYTFSHFLTSQIFIGKQTTGITFDGLQQEYNREATEPYGFYISAADASPVSPWVRGLLVTSSRIYPIYGEDAAKIGGLVLEGTTFTGTKDWLIDVDYLYDSTIHFEPRLDSNIAFPQYRVRTESAGNQWNPSDTSGLPMPPTITKGSTIPTGGKLVADDYYWAVTSLDAGGETLISNEITATVAADGSQKIGWSQVTDATGYKVYRGTATGTYSTLIDERSVGGYMNLPGTASYFASSPDSPDVSVIGDIDIRIQASCDWSPAAISAYVSKFVTSGQYGWWLYTSGATLIFQWSENGTDLLTVVASAGVTLVDNTVGWLRVTLDVDGGAGGIAQVKFYQSTDGETWTQIGTAQEDTGSSAPSSIYDGTDQIEVGSRANGLNSPLTAQVYRAQIFDGIDGTLAFDADFSGLNSIEYTARSFIENANDATVTIQNANYTLTPSIAVDYLDTGATGTATSPPSEPTAGRPSAAYRGVGASMFDTTLGYPIWSDGTNWLKATGLIG